MAASSNLPTIFGARLTPKPPSPPLTTAGFFPMRLILILAALYAALAIVNHLNPGPGDADVRGEATSVQP